MTDTNMNKASSRLIDPKSVIEDQDELNLRPESLNDFVGQQILCENLSVFVSAAIQRAEPIDHVLLHGPPGLGKTTLARIVALELGVGFRATSGPIITKAGDLAAILTNLQPRDVLFIDEIHRLNPAVEEILYPAMEDGELDLIIGEGPAARSVRIELQPFTVIGATTRLGLLSTPLRERFGINLRLEFYSPIELISIIKRNAKLFDLHITDDGAAEIANRSRGSPRVAGRLLRRVRDFSVVQENMPIDDNFADMALNRLEVDSCGLDSMDHQYLLYIINNFDGGPVGIETISAALSEERDTIEAVVEPFLMQKGFLQRTSRGRMVTSGGYNHLGIEPPIPDQGDILERHRLATNESDNVSDEDELG